jgi:Tol biopolymer transport system component
MLRDHMAANTGDGYHIWRQRFPNGTPEQVTSGGTQEQGISFAPDGRSFVTSVGASESTLWFHDANGDRQITSEGYAFLPTFSRDGKTLYYLVRSHTNRAFVNGELWSVSLETGHSARLLPDFLMEQYNISADGKRVVFLTNDGGHSQLRVAPLDGGSAPRVLATEEYSPRALFDPNGGVLFVGKENGAAYLYHINEDGTGQKKLFPAPVLYLYSISPDGKAVAVWVGTDVYVDSYDGSSQTFDRQGPWDGGRGTARCDPCFGELVSGWEVPVRA